MFAKITSTIGFCNNSRLSQEGAASFDLSSAQLKASSLSPQTGLHLRSQGSVTFSDSCLTSHQYPVVKQFKQGMRPTVSCESPGVNHSHGDKTSLMFMQSVHVVLLMATLSQHAAMLLWQDFMLHLHDTGPVALVSASMLTWLQKHP